MDSTLIRLIQESWMRVGPGAVESFYDKLFALRPGLRSMFPTDMTTQQKKLHQMLATVVKGLRNLDALMPAVEELGRRHANYGVLPGHYKVVGEALLATLAEGLGPHWSPEVAEAWVTAYTALSETMINAAEAHRRATYRRPRRLSTNGGYH